VRQARDEPELYGCGGAQHDDGDGRGGVLGRDGRGCRPGGDDVHLELDELGGEGWQAVGLSLGKSLLDQEGPAFDPPELTETLSNAIDGRTARWASGKDTEARDLAGPVARG
jgi:hypothetical protein